MGCPVHPGTPFMETPTLFGIYPIIVSHIIIHIPLLLVISTHKPSISLCFIRVLMFPMISHDIPNYKQQFLMIK